MYIYQDRQDAGSDLAQLIMSMSIANPILLALPRGGVPVASIISHELGIPFEVLVTRKIGFPGQELYSIGAMSEDGLPLITEDINFADPRILEIINEERHEIKNKIELYRGNIVLPEVVHRNIILVDDALTDGNQVLASAKFLKTKGAKKILLAVPIAPIEEIPGLTRYIDEIICPHRVQLQNTAEKWYQDYSQVTDREVLDLLHRNDLGDQSTWHI